MKRKPVSEQVVVIMGATSGIGRAAALMFAQRGAKVVASGRSQDELDGLVDEIHRRGGVAIGQVAEVTKFQQVARVADQAVLTFGRIDTWVHSTAIMMYALLEETKPEEFKQMLEVNLIGQAYGAMAALPYLKREGRGAFISLSSAEGQRSLPLQSAYAASKFALEGMLDTLRMELEHEGIPIGITSIRPAGVNTPLYSKALTRLGVKPMPVPPIYSPDLVAEAIVFAAEHPTRDLFVGGAGKALALLHRLNPRLGDYLLRGIAFKGQRTDQPKSAAAPHNLFEHIPGYDRVEGPYKELQRDTSVYTWLRTRPAARLGLMILPALLGGFLLARSLAYRKAGSGRNWDWARLLPK